jgi:hypothetical protein
MRNLFHTILLGAAAAGIALAGGDFQWQGPIAAGQLLEIRGVNGSIHASGASGSTATVSVTKSGKNSDPAEVNIQVVQYVGGVVICAMYPDGNGKPPNVCNPPGMDNYVSANNNDVQVEFTVEVPQGVKLSANAVNGDIDATSLTGDVEAHTVIGNVTVSTTGAVQATTLKGKVTVEMGTVNWKGVHMIDSSQGDVDVTIPANANVSVRASAFRGTIMTDFPLTISPSVLGGSTMGDGTLGSDGRSLRLSTFQGNITLHRGQ